MSTEGSSHDPNSEPQERGLGPAPIPDYESPRPQINRSPEEQRKFSQTPPPDGREHYNVPRPPTIPRRPPEEHREERRHLIRESLFGKEHTEVRRIYPPSSLESTANPYEAMARVYKDLHRSGIPTGFIREDLDESNQPFIEADAVADTNMELKRADDIPREEQIGMILANYEPYMLQKIAAGEPFVLIDPQQNLYLDIDGVVKFRGNDDGSDIVLDARHNPARAQDEITALTDYLNAATHVPGYFEDAEQQQELHDKISRTIDEIASDRGIEIDPDTKERVLEMAADNTHAYAEMRSQLFYPPDTDPPALDSPDHSPKPDDPAPTTTAADLPPPDDSLTASEDESVALKSTDGQTSINEPRASLDTDQTPLALTSGTNASPTPPQTTPAEPSQSYSGLKDIQEMLLEAKANMRLATPEQRERSAEELRAYRAGRAATQIATQSEDKTALAPSPEHTSQPVPTPPAKIRAATGADDARAKDIDQALPGPASENVKRSRANLTIGGTIRENISKPPQRSSGRSDSGGSRGRGRGL